MASPFEIIALTETVTHLGHKIYTFFSSLKDAPQEVRDLCIELDSLRTILLDIGVSASNIGDATTINSKALGLDAILTSLRVCETEFNTIWLAVSSLYTIPGLKWSQVRDKLSKSLRWVLEADSIEKSVHRLEREKQNLALAMILSGMKVSNIILQTISLVGCRVEQNGVVITSHLQELERTLLLNLRQVEYRLLQRVSDLSAITSRQHAENDRRMANLSESLPEAQSQQATAQEDGSVLDDDATQSTSNGGASPLDVVPGPESINPHGSISINNDSGGTPEASIATAFQHAMQNWKSMLSLKDMEMLDEATMDKPLTDLSSALTSWESVLRTKDKKISSRIRSSLESYCRVIETLVQTSPKYSALMWGSVKLVLQATERHSELTTMTEVLEQITRAFDICHREYVLYPEPKIEQLMVALYSESLSGMTAIFKSLQEPRSVMQRWSDNRLHRTATKVNEFSEKIIREVEYLHRRELREAHIRLREVDRKQDQVIRAMEEQQRILMSLQEEQKLTAAVTDHQKVLQMLQQLLAKYPSSNETFAGTTEESQEEIKGDQGALEVVST